MNLRYNITNQINLSNFVDMYDIPAKYRTKAMYAYDKIFEYISESYINSSVLKLMWVNAINTITYIIFQDDSFPSEWNADRPLEHLPQIDSSELRDVLGEYYLEVDSLIWDVVLKEDTFDSTSTVSYESEELVYQDKADTTVNSSHNTRLSRVNKPLSKNKTDSIQFSSIAPLTTQTSDQVDIESATKLTSMHDIMLDPGYPYFPMVDFSDYWIVCKDEFGEEFGIPRSLPIIPQRQSDITATTELNKMVDSDLMKLYPNHIMKLRSELMYNHFEGYDDVLDYDDDLGVIFPIEGFTKEQVIDNIIKYPDIINIGLGRIGKQRQYEGDQRPRIIWEEFHKRIEIDGQLHLVTQDLWNELPELRKLPPNQVFQQEYIVRKYLLEKDNGITREKLPYGETYPFITLFMPPGEYINRGYKDVVEIARSCVKSRVYYFRTRNPMLRRLGIRFNYEGEMISE